MINDKNQELQHEESRIRARNNWKILREKIRDTKTEANWLVQQLDKKKEKAQQNMQGLEIDEIKQQQDIDKIGNTTTEQASNVPCLNIIIHP